MWILPPQNIDDVSFTIRDGYFCYKLFLNFFKLVSALFNEIAEVNGNFPPLMLALGYTQGVQIWSIPMTGEAQEVLAWRQGQVKTLKVC